MAELAELEAALSESQASWKLVVGHHPVRSNGIEHGDTPELRREQLFFSSGKCYSIQLLSQQLSDKTPRLTRPSAACLLTCLQSGTLIRPS